MCILPMPIITVPDKCHPVAKDGKIIFESCDPECNCPFCKRSRDEDLSPMEKIAKGIPFSEQDKADGAALMKSWKERGL